MSQNDQFNGDRGDLDEAIDPDEATSESSVSSTPIPALNQNLRFFLVHVFFHITSISVPALGWPYLYLNGVSIWQLILVWFFIRFVSAHLGLRIGWRIMQYLPSCVCMTLGIAFQALFVRLLPDAPTDQTAFFMLFLCVLCSEALYWPARNQFLRSLSHLSNVGKSFSYISSTEIVASLLGLSLSGLGLHYAPELTFNIATAGLMLSTLPLFFIDQARGKAPKGRSFAKAISESSGVLDTMPRYVLMMFAIACIINEIFLLLGPLTMAQQEASMVELGFLMALFYLVPFVLNFFVGRMDDRGDNRLFIILGLLSSLTALAFLTSYSPQSVAIFVFAISFTLRSWTTALFGKSLRYISMLRDTSDLSGGFYFSYHYHVAVYRCLAIILLVFALLNENVLYYLICTIALIGPLLGIHIVTKNANSQKV